MPRAKPGWKKVAADAAAVRHLAAARDRDLADLTVKVDANRQAINALGVQTAAGFARLGGRKTGYHIAAILLGPLWLADEGECGPVIELA